MADAVAYTALPLWVGKKGTTPAPVGFDPEQNQCAPPVIVK